MIYAGKDPMHTEKLNHKTLFGNKVANGFA